MTKVLVVDDHESLRRSVTFLLECNSLEVCGEAESGEEAVKKVAELKPDVVIIDARLPHGMDGLQAAREIRRISPTTKILICSLHEDAAIESAVLEAGADGYVSKTSGGSKLVDAIRRLL
jgi:two-component system invasion response regulator UvrY